MMPEDTAQDTPMGEDPVADDTAADDVVTPEDTEEPVEGMETPEVVGEEAPVEEEAMEEPEEEME